VTPEPAPLPPQHAAPTHGTPKPSIPLLLGISLAILAADWWTKRWATATLAGRPSVPVIGELVRFTYTRNSGVAFGLGAGLPFPYYIFSIAAAIAIVWLFARQRVPNTARRIALALILGGALGNLVDRMRVGEVVDFIEVGWGHWHWPVFNVADSAVSIGVVLFALAWPKHGAEHHEAAAPDAPPDLAPPDEPSAGAAQRSSIAP
jgi:signal peptidase II